MLGILFPVRGWARDAGWRHWFRLAVMVYTLLPLVFLAVFASAGSPTAPGWAYSLYLAPLWAIGFWLLIQPGPAGTPEVQVSIGIVVWILIWTGIVTGNIDHALTGPGGLSLPAAIIVGINEQVSTALPVLLAGLYLLRRRQVRLGVRMWMFVGTLAGLAFGVGEQAFFSSSDFLAVSRAVPAHQGVSAVLDFAERVFVTGFQHAVWAGIAGFFIGMALSYRRRRRLIVTLAIAAPALLQGLSDWAASHGSVWGVVLIQAVSLLLFLGYAMSAEAIERQVRQSPLFRGDSMIMERVDQV